MSVEVELAQLQERVDEYGPVALLVSVTEDGKPHVVSVAVEVDDSSLVADVGKTTAANAQRSPALTMVWPAPPGGDYAFLVDGAASVDGSRISIEPVRAVLHRIAGAPDTLPSCVTVLDRR